MKKVKTIRNFFMMLCLVSVIAGLFSFSAKPVSAATNPGITVKSVTNLTTTNAQINATVSNPSQIRLKKAGFILYNASGSQLANKYDSINYTLKSFNAWFDLNEYYGKLNPGTTYKYRFYVMNSSGTYYYSSFCSFTTKTAVAAPSVSANAVSNLTSTNAQLNAVISNPSKTKITRSGFLLYNANGALLANKYDSCSCTGTSFKSWFNLNSYYGKLTAGTTYKYKFYIVNSSGTYYSNLYSFQTSAASSAKYVGYTESIKAFVSNAKWDTGSPSGNAVGNYCGSYRVAGSCMAYAADFIMYTTGNSNWQYTSGTRYYDLTQIRVGDVLHNPTNGKGTHTFCIIGIVSKSANRIVVKTAEGNDGGKSFVCTGSGDYSVLEKINGAWYRTSYKNGVKYSGPRQINTYWHFDTKVISDKTKLASLQSEWGARTSYFK